MRVDRIDQMVQRKRMRVAIVVGVVDVAGYVKRVPK